MPLNLNQLRVFNAIYEQNSITAAARALRISQPAVSKQLAELEGTVGAILVDRLPRGVRLTAAGETLREHTRAIFQSEAAAESALRKLLGLEQGTLAVGASTTVGSYLVPRVLGTFHREHEDIKLELEIGNTATIQTALHAGRLDVGLTEGLVTSDALQVEVFARDEMVVIAAPSHELVEQGPLELDELERQPLVFRERGSGTRDVVVGFYSKGSRS